MTPGARLRTLFSNEKLPMVPGCHDALGARLTEEAGCAAAYISGFCVATSYGKPDVGILTMSEVVAEAARIAGSVSIPVIADADTGYGGAINIRETVREMERAGIAGIHLEDQKMPKRCGALAGKELVSDEEMTFRLRVARESRISPDFVIIGRTDAMTLFGVEECVRRCKVMEKAGADAVMVPSLSTPAELAAVAKSVSIPTIYVAAETVRPMYSQKQLKEFGFSLALYPLSLIMASAGIQKKLLRAMLDTGTTEGLIPEMMAFTDVGALVGTKEAATFEEKLLKGQSA
jgi:methylisocitrate lyase